jgi:MbtH protein
MDQSPGNTDQESRDRMYDVVINEEGQYSIWPKPRAIPAGWDETGFHGTRDECLAHIETVWTDMRPRSLQLKDKRSGAC